MCSGGILRVDARFVRPPRYCSPSFPNIASRERSMPKPDSRSLWFEASRMAMPIEWRRRDCVSAGDRRLSTVDGYRRGGARLAQTDGGFNRSMQQLDGIVQPVYRSLVFFVDETSELGRVPLDSLIRPCFVNAGARAYRSVPGYLCEVRVLTKPQPVQHRLVMARRWRFASPREGTPCCVPNASPRIAQCPLSCSGGPGFRLIASRPSRR